MRALLSVQFHSLFSRLFTLGKPTKKRGPASKILIGLLAVYIFAALGSSVGFFFHMLYAPLRDAGLRWFYFSLGGLSAFVMSFIGSVFLAQSTLYEAKDNELLLSMPIRPGTILASRFTTLLGSAFVMQQLFLLPGAVVWWLGGPVSAASVAAYILTSLLLSFLVAALSGLGGYLLMRAASRVRRKSLVLTALSLLFLGAYLYGYSRLMGLMNTLTSQGAAIADAVRRALFPAYHFGRAVDGGNALSLLLFALCALIPFALVYALIRGRYLKMLTDKRGERKQAYVSRELKASHPFGALVLREIKRFSGSVTYMMNSALGLVFMPIFPVALMLNGEWQTTLSSFQGLTGILAPASAMVLCLLCASVFISAPSISLEGRSLWIAQTLPVTARQILFSKAAAHALLTVPFQALSALLTAILLKTSLRDTLALFLLPLPVIAFTALLGVALNLRFPKLEWRTVTEPVKQGVSTILSMFGAMVTVAAPVALWLLVLRDRVGLYPFMLLFALFFLLLSGLLYLHLHKSAQKALLALGEK